VDGSAGGVAVTIMSPATAASFLHVQREQDRREDAEDEFRDDTPTTVGPAVDEHGLEDGLSEALGELAPHARLHVLTMTGDQRRRAVELLVGQGVLMEHDQQRAELWLRATARPAPRYGADQARAKAVNTELAHAFVSQKGVP
jgi:hypothetical protein